MKGGLLIEFLLMEVGMATKGGLMFVHFGVGRDGVVGVTLIEFFKEGVRAIFTPGLGFGSGLDFGDPGVDGVKFGGEGLNRTKNGSEGQIDGGGRFRSEGALLFVSSRRGASWEGRSTWGGVCGRRGSGGSRDNNVLCIC